MYIKCWGSRGSIPVSGKEYLKYGGDTTCLEIRTGEGHIIIVDAGTGIRRLGRKLVDEGATSCSILFTHWHWDHLIGFPFFMPIYRKEWDITFLNCPDPGASVKKNLSSLMRAPNFPVDFSELQAKLTFLPDCPEKFHIGAMEVTSIPLSHPNGGRGYRFEEGGKSFVFLTDNELDHDHRGRRAFEDYRDFSSGADLLIHDSEYTPGEYDGFRGWGHSNYADTVELALCAGVKQLGLFHTNADRTDDAMDEIVRACEGIIRKKGGTLSCIGVGCDTVFKL